MFLYSPPLFETSFLFVITITVIIGAATLSCPLFKSFFSVG